jgi:hypothetical protein
MSIRNTLNMNFTLIFFVQLTLGECIQTLMNSHSKSIFITVEQKHIHNLELLPLQLILNHKINCQPRRVSWHPPTAPAIKLNVDGSSLGNPRQSGYGSILPNNKGKWLLGFMGYSGYTINMNAERYQLHIMVCNSAFGLGSSSLIRWILLILVHHLCLGSRSLCEGNSCADWLAK